MTEEIEVQQATHPATRRGFTIIELLVVIGIIMVLMSILLPVVVNVRKAVYNASTRQMISRLEAGVNVYFNEHGQYPGPFSNAQINSRPNLYPTAPMYPLTFEWANSGTSYSTDSARTKVTAPENLYVGIVGGLYAPTTANPTFRVATNYGDVPSAPLSLNPAQLKRYAQYINIQTRETTAGVDTRFYPNAPLAVRYACANDTSIPEILDAYPEPMPILYMRAYMGQPQIIGVTGDERQYNRDHLTPYGFPATNDAAYTADFPSNGVLAAGDEAYFGNPGLSIGGLKVPYQKDGFILISAGVDGIYGTKDDITNIRN
jgi:prepilin-type N-terminal cleavage/methylation domain-containing protein